MIPIVFGVALFLAAVLVVIAVMKSGRSASAVAAQDRAAFEESFPPISDAEFLARCTPGTNPEVALKVRRIVAEYFGIEYERVHPSTQFIEDLDA
jgi:hypothetical protein